MRQAPGKTESSRATTNRPVPYETSTRTGCLLFHANRYADAAMTWLHALFAPSNGPRITREREGWRGVCRSEATPLQTP
jgi:hypothetical protein